MASTSSHERHRTQSEKRAPHDNKKQVDGSRSRRVQTSLSREAARGVGRSLCRYLGGVTRDEDRAAALPDELLQELWENLIRVYAAKVEYRPRDTTPPPPFRPGAGISATEAVVVVLEMLKAADVAVFELGMWQALGTY